MKIMKHPYLQPENVIGRVLNLEKAILSCTLDIKSSHKITSSVN